MNLKVKIEKTDEAKKLERLLKLNFDLIQGFPLDAGFDLRACIPQTIYIAPYNKAIIPSGLKMEMGSPNFEIQIRPRSGLAAKNGIFIVNSPGTIDFGYRQEIQLIVGNFSAYEFKIEPGDRIAQACFREVPAVTFEYVDKIEEKITLSQKIEAGVLAKGNTAVRQGLGSTGQK